MCGGMMLVSCRRSAQRLTRERRGRQRAERDQQPKRNRLNEPTHRAASIHRRIWETYSSTRRSRNAFAITDTELRLMAAAAIIGESSSPSAG